MLRLLSTLPLVAALDMPPVQLWHCGSPSTQHWTLNASGAVPPGSGFRVALSPTQVWDLSGPSNKTGTLIHLFHPYSNQAQFFKLENVTAGGVQIASAGYARGMCAVASASYAGAQLTIQPCHGVPAATSVFTFDSAAGVLALAADPSLCVDAGSFANCSTPPTSGYPFCNPALPPDARAADLSARASVAELASFLGNQNNGIPSLGVPRVGYGEALHGLLRNCLSTPMENSTGCPTSFPHLLLLSSTFNRTLWRRVAAAIADEGRAYFNLANRTSHLISWAPDINPYRDPRWGRGQEVAGEDALLISEFIYEYAQGMQIGEDSRYIKFVSTAKHFSMYDLENATAYDGTYYLRQNFTAVVSRRDAAQFYWPPFLAATQRGGVKSIMCSYNSVCLDCDPSVINGTGTPSCADSALQNEMVRGEWGWDGFFVSDCDAVKNIFDPHHFAPSGLDAAVMGLLGGTDIDCGNTYSQYLGAAVAAGNLTEAALRLAAYRNMRVAFGLGLWDAPGSVSYDSIGPGRLDSADNRALSLEAAIQGLVLLQNNATAGGKPLLPLSLPALRGKGIALIGPLANATQTLLSNYEGGNTLVDSHSILAALSARAGAAGVPLRYAPGCVNSTGGTTVWCIDGGGFAPAVDAAAAADVAVVVVGLCSTCPLDGWRLEGEGHDRHELTLPGQQEALVKAVAATGTPVVLVLVHGGALAIENLLAVTPSILDAHYPGQLGGDAVAAVLLGDASPSGRLTTTVYPAGFVQQRALTDMALAPHGGRPGVTHLYVPRKDVVFPFGWGLSYTTFKFTWLSAASSVGVLRLGAAPPQYTVNVTNVGSVTSDVSVLGMYSTGIPGEPLEELFDFERVAALAPGQTVTVTLSLPAGVAAAVDAKGVKSLVAGEFDVRIGEPDHWIWGKVRVEGGVLTVKEATKGPRDFVSAA